MKFVLRTGNCPKLLGVLGVGNMFSGLFSSPVGSDNRATSRKAQQSQGNKHEPLSRTLWTGNKAAEQVDKQ